MKRCPTCNRTYADLSLNFCLDDGTPLTSDAAPTTDLNATVRYPAPRDTSEPPPTEIYRPAPTVAPAPPPRPTQPPPPLPQPRPQPQQQWSPTPAIPAKKSNAIWWILGGFAVLMVIGAGLVVMVLVLANMDTNSNVRISNANNGNSNLSANTNTNVNANANTNINANVGPPSSLTDDFSLSKWGTATTQFGRSWYSNSEYHMSSKDQTFFVMYGPSNDYGTENANVKVTARSVSGNAPSSGFGLMVHCLQSKAGQLEDYALLIYPTDDPAYEIIMHKGGNQSTLVDRTKSDAIFSGAEPNELQIKIKGTQMTFLANGRVLTTVTDKENYRKGRVGFYTSDVYEVAFDDLSIERSTP